MRVKYWRRVYATNLRLRALSISPKARRPPRARPTTAEGSGAAAMGVNWKLLTV